MHGCLTSSTIISLCCPLNKKQVNLLLSLNIPQLITNLFYYYIKQKQMEKHNWQKVLLSKNTRQPSPRWGHCSLSIGEQIVLFGGYADSNYMNDVWSFHTTKMIWTQHKTTGIVPSIRSNCTMHYDSINKRIILFGGGGPNKQRFNVVCVLDWETKIWSQIRPNQAQNSPWQRTYHSSQLLYPYLIIFGGEGISDMEDLWLFNLQTQIWKEIVSNKDKPKPCARRFHSSALIGNQFYVLAGCHGKYRCLSDIYSIDLTHFITTGKTDELQWKQLKLKGSSFLTRWGHTSLSHQNKIYVFGGRFSSDLQDILIITPQKQTLNTMKVAGDIPRARRRHSVVFQGSCMIIYGGFNGQYFNDMYYINTFDIKTTKQIQEGSRDVSLVQWVNRSNLADYQVISKQGRIVHVHQGLIAPRFKSSADRLMFLEYLQNKFGFQQLLEIFQILYLGVGKMSEELNQFDIQIYDNFMERDNAVRKAVKPQLYEIGSLLPKTRFPSSSLITLQPEQYSEYIDNCQLNKHHDLVLILNQQYCLPANRSLLAVNSLFFSNFLSHCKQVQIQLQLPSHLGDVRVFQVLLNYLQTDYLVIPSGLDERCWVLMFQLSEYFCLQKLMHICQIQLIAKLNQSNCQPLLQYGLTNQLSNLALHSGQYLFRILLQKGDIQTLNKLKMRETWNDKQKLLSKILQLLNFDLLQTEKRKERALQESDKVVGQQNYQKQNSQCLIGDRPSIN